MFRDWLSSTKFWVSGLSVVPSAYFSDMAGPGIMKYYIHMSFAVFTVVYAVHNRYATSHPKTQTTVEPFLVNFFPSSRWKNPTSLILVIIYIYTYQHQGSVKFSEFCLWDLLRNADHRIGLWLCSIFRVDLYKRCKDHVSYGRPSWCGWYHHHHG